MELKRSRSYEIWIAFVTWFTGGLFVVELLRLSERVSRGQTHGFDVGLLALTTLLGVLSIYRTAYRLEATIDDDGIEFRELGFKRSIRWSDLLFAKESKLFLKLSHRTTEGKLKYRRIGRVVFRRESWQTLLDMVRTHRPDLLPPLEISKAPQ